MSTFLVCDCSVGSLQWLELTLFFLAKTDQLARLWEPTPKSLTHFSLLDRAPWPKRTRKQKKISPEKGQRGESRKRVHSDREKRVLSERALFSFCLFICLSVCYCCFVCFTAACVFLTKRIHSRLPLYVEQKIKIYRRRVVTTCSGVRPFVDSVCAHS